MTELLLKRFRCHQQWLMAPLDAQLLLIAFVLLSYALFILGSASPQRLGGHAFNLSIAFCTLWIAAFFPLSRLKAIAPLLYAAAIILLVAVALFGDVSKGARRWLDIGFTRIQPSEIMKIAMPLMLAWFYSRRDGQATGWDHGRALVLLMLPVLLIARQPDLGTGILVFVSGFFVLYFAGIPWRWITPVVLLGCSGVVTLVLFGDLLCQKEIAWPLIKEYQKHRVCTLLDPASDPLGKGFHIIQSMIAVGSGGVFGKGWGSGTQSQLDFLPERHTDFVFAVLSEEFGLVGNVFLLILYIALISRGLMIASRAKDKFGRYLAGSLAMGIFAYALVNMGMVTGIFPVVGVPLPFVSYGGTSLVILSISLGLLMSIANDKAIFRH